MESVKVIGSVVTFNEIKFQSRFLGSTILIPDNTIKYVRPKTMIFVSRIVFNVGITTNPKLK